MKYYTKPIQEVQSKRVSPEYQILHKDQWLNLIPRFDHVGGKGIELTYQVEGTLYGYGHSDVQEMLATGMVCISNNTPVLYSAKPSEMSVILSEAA